MNCPEVVRQLSAYLDGELNDHATSALRGHLRTCDQCRSLADTEAKLVAALRELPALEPPPALWQAVRAQLAEQEIADARAGWATRLWRRAARGARPYLPPLGGGALAAAAVAALLWWPSGEDGRALRPKAAPSASPSAVVGAAPPATSVDVVDVAAALTDEAALADQSYQQATAELAELIEQERASWDAAYARGYDERVAALRARVADLPAGVERERAQRELMRYLQTALTRAELAMGAP